MQILFTTNVTNAPSTVLNENLLRGINSFNNITIDFYNKNYDQYDVILFMGYDPEIKDARKVNKKAKIGVIDPRPSFKVQPSEADFIIVNGIEMKDWYAKISPNVCLYYIYPVLDIKNKEHKQTKKIILGYHGNKIHLNIMYPRITKAIEMLGSEFEVEFWIMYNINKLGKFSNELPKNVSIKHVQWSEGNYEKYMSKVDIGIVPNLIPLTNKDKPKKTSFFSKKSFNEHKSDYVLRFKATSNSGRMFVFMQYSIPIVADMFPSALQLIDDGINGYVCHSTEGWYYALKKLTVSPELRTSFSKSMLEKFHNTISQKVMNRNLVEFIKKV